MLLYRMNISIGFDLGALVREYKARVPYELDFLYEANVAQYLRYKLLSH